MGFGIDGTTSPWVRRAMTKQAITAEALLLTIDEFLMLVSETLAYHCRDGVQMTAETNADDPHEESSEFHRHDNLLAVLQEVVGTLRRLHTRARLASRRYVVAVVGMTNVGKSTLLSALLGSELAPRRNGPCTAAPIEFVNGDALRVTVHYHQSFRRPVSNCQDTEEVHQRLSQLVDDEGAEASQRIRKVEVQVPHPLLRHGLVIADTPGFGAAQLGEAARSHENALQQYLTHDVSQVFWLVLGDQGIGQRERLFYDKFCADVCDDVVVVTGSDDWEKTDRDRFRRRFSDLFGQRLPPRFHFASGLRGLQARE